MTSLRARAQAAFPAGSNGEFNLPPELSMVIARGDGCRLWNTDGREFLDFSIGWGSVLVGHANPAVTEAVTRQASLGANFAYVNENALALAETIADKSPLALRYLKRTIDAGADMPLPAALAHEQAMISLVLDSEDAHEGCRAFLEKREARFKGA